jgi:hypothetical protein
MAGSAYELGRRWFRTWYRHQDQGEREDWTRLDFGGGDGKVKAGREGAKRYVGRLDSFLKRWFWIRGRAEFLLYYGASAL